MKDEPKPSVVVALRVNKDLVDIELGLEHYGYNPPQRFIMRQITRWQRVLGFERRFPARPSQATGKVRAFAETDGGTAGWIPRLSGDPVHHLTALRAARLG